MHEFRSDSTVDAAADRPNHSSLRPADITNACDFLTDKLFLVTAWAIVSDVLLHLHSNVIANHGPIRGTVTDVKNELSDNFSPAWRVGDLGVELDAVPRLVVMGDGCKWSIMCMPDDVEVRRNFRELISMRHPDL